MCLDFQGTAAIKGIFLDMSKIRKLDLNRAAFLKMYNLRLLKFYNSELYNLGNSKVCLPQDLKSLPDTLRYLYWDGYPSKCLPLKFDPHNLVELEMPRSQVERLWHQVQVYMHKPRCTFHIFFYFFVLWKKFIFLFDLLLQDLENLRKVNLRSSKHLIEIPELSKSRNIESIDLESCKSLVQVPSYFQSLDKLTYLNLGDCSNLKHLPEISKNMEFLDLHGTAIEELPTSIWSMEKLVLLDLNFCKNLKHLPTSPCKLDSLQFLSLKDCFSLDKFPELPRYITDLRLSGTAIEVVPSSVECLSGLVTFEMENCKKLQSLPTSICKLKSLQRLSLSGCSNLKSFPEIEETMERLSFLNLNNTAVREVPSSIQNLVGLKILQLSMCGNLEFVPDSLYNLDRLQNLLLYGSLKLERLPPMSASLCSLTVLDLSECNIFEIPDQLISLSSLERLDLSGTMIERIPESIKQVSGLYYLNLSNCKRLQSLPELPSLIESFDAHGCTSLESVSRNPFKVKLDQYQVRNRYEELILSNCLKLDKNAWSNIMADAQLRIMRTATASLKLKDDNYVCISLSLSISPLLLK